MANGTYIIQLRGTASDGNAANDVLQTSQITVTVAGEYKPGRVAFGQTDVTVPVTGLPISTTRSYDSLNRDVSGDFGNGWQYDLSQQIEVDPNTLDVTLTQPNGKRVTSYSANVLDQIISDGNHTFGYDKRGNLVSDGATGNAYAFDAANRMSQALTVSGTTSNTYDADGRRIQQKTGNVTTNFLWDCGCAATTNVLLETDVTGAAQASYTIADGAVLAQTKGGATSYLLLDGQGSVRTLTNASGTITESHVYDAYGALRDASSSPSTRYLYTGQMLDAGTGLYNLRARSYNTALGQFLSRDSVNDGTNFYGYVHGNPINHSDPSGHGTNVTDPPKTQQSQGGSETAALYNNSLNQSSGLRILTGRRLLIGSVVLAGGLVIAYIAITNIFDQSKIHPPTSTPGITPPNSTPSSEDTGTPNTQPSPNSTSKPGQTCSDARLKKLTDAKGEACSKRFSCSDTTERTGRKKEKSLTCEQLHDNITTGEGCLAARQKIQDECFGGKPDDSHKDEIKDIRKAVDECRRKYFSRYPGGCGAIIV